MPNQPKTPHRHLRVDHELWTKFSEATADRSATLRDFIRWYVREPGVKVPPRPDR